LPPLVTPTVEERFRWFVDDSAAAARGGTG
jgi:hypothetical protein